MTLHDELPVVPDRKGSGVLEGQDLDLAFAGVAEAVNATGPQDALVLADIEARLTQEVRGLIAALTQFSGNAELIRKDGAEYLHELNLCLSDFVREVDLDGRSFLAIALVDKQPGKLSSSSDGVDQC